MILYAMGAKLQELVDVTIAYPEGVPGLWDFFCGRTRKIRVHLQLRPIPEDLKDGRYFEDAPGRRPFYQWLDHLWSEKDDALEALLSEEG